MKNNEKLNLLRLLPLLLFLILSSCTKNQSLSSINNGTEQIMSIVGDKTNNQNAPNGPGGDLRVFRCLSTGCVDPDVHAECPCASCFDGHGNCLGWVNVENMAPTNITIS